MLVFIDESGDSGFKTSKGSSPIFVVALTIFDDPLDAEKTSLAIKELRRELHVNDLYEFKYSKCDKRFKELFFHRVVGYSFRIRAIVVQKDVIKSNHLRTNKENFYNYIIMQILKHSGSSVVNAKLKFDKRGEKEIRDQLRVYLSTQLDNKRKKIFTDLKFVDSKQNTLIQLADMVAGTISSYYSGKYKTYSECLKKAKKFEDIWIFK